MIFYEYANIMKRTLVVEDLSTSEISVRPMEQIRVIRTLEAMRFQHEGVFKNNTYLYAAKMCINACIASYEHVML